MVVLGIQILLFSKNNNNNNIQKRLKYIGFGDPGIILLHNNNNNIVKIEIYYGI